jgi:glycosyltransferase involved in cell wall biosynthesis
MRFAIITPTIGREVLKRCLITMKHQVHNDFLHIVVGDGPQDKWVVDECSAHNCYYTNTEVKEGFYGAAPRNHALKLIESGNLGYFDYICFVDDDNVLLESALYNVAKHVKDNNNPPLVWHDILFTNKYKTIYYVMPKYGKPLIEGDWDFLNCFFRSDVIRGIRVKQEYNHDHLFTTEVDVRAGHKWSKCDGIGGVHFLSWDTYELKKPGVTNGNI